MIPTSAKSNPVKSSLAAVTTTVTISSVPKQQQQSELVNESGHQNQIESKTDETIDNKTNKLSSDSHKAIDILDESNLPNSSFDVPDPYDPFKPNDYLLYCEERLEEKRLQKLEEENQKVFLELEKKRLEKEKERAEAIEKGDMKKLQSTISVGGRGRGGLSNLPAWMTQTHTTNTETDTATSTTATTMSTSPRDTYKYEDIETSDKSDKDNRYKDDDRYSDSHRHHHSSSSSSKSRTDSYTATAHSERDRGYDSDGRKQSGHKKDEENHSQRYDKHSSSHNKSYRDSTSTSSSSSSQDIHMSGNKNKASFGYSSNRDRSDSEDDDYTDKKYKTTSNSSSRNSSSSSSQCNDHKKPRITTNAFANLTCVVLLKNMTVAGGVDEDLAEETKQECTKYGPVLKCVIHEVKDSELLDRQRAYIPDEERVRLFIHFERQDSAVKCFREMNGRFFGGRKITASFYDEDKFYNNDLKPTVDDW